MTKRKLRYVFAVIPTCLWAFLCSCDAVNRNSLAESEPTPPAVIQSKESNPRSGDQTHDVEFRGVRLENRISAVSEIAGSDEPALLLELETDKPDDVWPRHTSLKLNGEYKERHQESFFSPEINIYPIQEFREALSKSAKYVGQFDKEIELLRTILAKKPSKMELVPRIPFYDGTPELKTRIKHISFKNGRGVLYLTQFNTEASLINNRGLTYVFQGLTDDEKYYVLGTFPVTLEILPNSYSERKFGDYELTEFFHGSKNWQAHEREYRKYLSSVISRLNSEPSSEFNPNLDEIEKTMSSLEVNWQ